MRGLLALVLGLTLTPPWAGAEAPVTAFVHDEADLFRASTRARAADEISEIRRLFHRDVLVETLPGLAPEDRKRVKGMRTRDEVAYFADLGQKHAEAAELNGILILICRDPKFVQVTVWPDEQRQTFSDDDAERLRKLLVVRRYFGGFDQALLAGLAMVKETLARNLGLDNPEDGPANGGSMVMVVMGLLGLWLILMLASSRLGKSSEGEPGGPHPALLGAMFGQPAAIWIYDRLFPAPSPGTAGTLATLSATSRPMLDSAPDLGTVAETMTDPEPGPTSPLPGG